MLSVLIKHLSILILDRIRRRHAEIRHAIFLPAHQFQSRMAIRVVQRVAFNLRVIPRVIHQHILAVWRLGKAVVPRPVLAVFIAGGEHRLR